MTAALAPTTAGRAADRSCNRAGPAARYAARPRDGRGAVSADRPSGAVLRDCGFVEFEAEAGSGGHVEQAVPRLRHGAPQREEARHVLDREAVRHGADEVDVDLGHAVTDDGHVER